MLLECVCDETNIKNCGIHSPIHNLEAEVAYMKNKEISLIKEKQEAQIQLADERNRLSTLQKAVSKFREWPEVEYDPEAWAYLDKSLEASKVQE